MTDTSLRTRARFDDCDKLKELTDAIQSFVCHVACIGSEVSTPEARRVAASAREYADEIAHDLGSEIRAAMFDLGRVESPPHVRLVPVVGSVNGEEG